ncbi:MAG TPA: hypothetical protein VNG71_18830 [Pyrinomonadaceae bacterium]|nr:hypothetical protein [Pyrinomonadaceae bacterium]
MSEVQTSGLQQAIETVESLSPEDQELLIDIVKRHLIDQSRDQMATEIADSRAAYQRGEVTRGSAEDLIKELAE